MKSMRLGIGALVAAGFLLALTGAATADTRQDLSAESALETNQEARLSCGSASRPSSLGRCATRMGS